MITQQDIQSLVNAVAQTGHIVAIDDLQLLIWTSGLQTHIPEALPNGFSAIYIFKWNNIYLKVGKVNSNSNARYQYHHYSPESSNSNLSRSLLSDPEFNTILGNTSPGVWIKENTTRFNILIPSDLGKNIVHFSEAFFILKCNSKFENTRI